MWNYRVCKETHSGKNSYNNETWTEVVYSVREVYYNNNGEPFMVSSESKGVSSSDNTGTAVENELLEDLSTALVLMADAVTKPVIDLDTIVFAKADD